MDIEQLTYFIALTEELNYTTASERCYVSRQAMRQTVQRLEQRYGTALIVNEKNRLTLTEAGRLLAQQAAKTVRAYEEMDTAMLALGAADTSLRVGVSRSLVPFYAPEVIAALEQFGRAHADIDVQIALCTADEVIAGLQGGRLGAGLVVDSGELALPLRRTVLRSDALRIALSETHPLAGREGLTLRDLDGQTLQVMSDPDVCFKTLRDALAGTGARVRFRVQTELVDVIYTLRDGSSLAIDRADEAETSIGTTKLLPLERDAFSLHCCLLTRPQEAPAAVLLRRHMLAEAKE